MNNEPLVIRMGNAPTEDEFPVEQEIDELIDELEGETQDKAYEKQVCRSFFLNFWRSWTRIPRKEYMRYRFQKLAGIIHNKTLAALTLPTGDRITFVELPSWYDVLKYKLCGFKYETYV